MLTVSAPLSSLTTYIETDRECLHFSADIEFPAHAAPPDSNKSHARLSILAGTTETGITERLSALTGLPNVQIAPNLPPISEDRTYFHLHQNPSTRLQTATLHLPHHHYLRLQSSIHRIAAPNALSFRVPLISGSPSAPRIPGTDLANPLALLFMLENGISLHAIPRLEIAISTLPAHTALSHHVPPLECQGA